MRHYEIVVMISAEQHDRGTAMAQRYKDMVTDGGGAIHRFEDWGSRRLAYPIGKRMRARYFIFNIECDGETLAKLKNDFRFSESIIRTLVLRRDNAVVEETPIMRDMKKAAKDNDDSASHDKSDAAAADTPKADAEVATATASDDGKEKDNEEKK